MDPDLRRRMLAYYDERAHEYEEVYTRGTGSASIPDPELFTRENREAAAVVARAVRGRVLDLACGTAYWLSYYAAQATHVTLVDQSSNMLTESRAKAGRLGVAARCTFRQGDVLEQHFEDGAFDTVLVGFLLSHLTLSDERRVLRALAKSLAPGGRLLILDSAWSPQRATYNVKEGRQARQLNDGTPFDIYKRYFDRDDIRRWAADCGLDLHTEYFGTVYLAVVGASSTAPHGS